MTVVAGRDGHDDGATTVLTGADAVGTSVVPAGTVPLPAGTVPLPVGGAAPAAVSAAASPVPTVVVPTLHDGRTRLVPAGPPAAPSGDAVDGTVSDEPAPGGLADDEGWDDAWDDEDPEYQAVEWIEEDLDASSGEPGEDTGYVRPSVPGRWVTQLVLAALVVACGARRPGLTLVVALAFFLLARAYGSTVEAMHGRREKRGVRGSDGWVALLTTPWHLLRAVLEMVPAVLVAGSVLVISVGFAWWAVGDGRWTIGDNVPGQELTGTTAAWLTGLAVLVGVLLVWFGPASRMTRVGTRRLLELVSPRRLGALVLVVVLLAVAAAIASRTLHGDPLVWPPLPVPTVPTR